MSSLSTSHLIFFGLHHLCLFLFHIHTILVLFLYFNLCTYNFICDKTGLLIVKEVGCETHMGFVDKRHPISLIRFGFKCSPPNAHPLKNCDALYLSFSYMNYMVISYIWTPPHLSSCYPTFKSSCYFALHSLSLIIIIIIIIIIFIYNSSHLVPLHALHCIVSETKVSFSWLFSSITFYACNKFAPFFHVGLG